MPAAARRHPGVATALVVSAGVLLVLGARLHRSVTASNADFGPSAVSTATTTAPSSGRAPRTSGTVRTPSPVSTAVRAGVPLRLVLPSVGVSAAVTTVGSSDGVLTVPDDPGTVGWWAGGALAGSTSGMTIIDGHVDSAATGPGALYRLEDLTAGAPVVIQLAGGGRLRYSVISRRSYLKATGLPAALFAPTGPPQLELISCGGRFDAATGSYESNIVVTALPAAAPR